MLEKMIGVEIDDGTGGFWLSFACIYIPQFGIVGKGFSLARNHG
jgi:hypothetical protein